MKKAEEFADRLLQETAARASATTAHSLSVEELAEQIFRVTVSHAYRLVKLPGFPAAVQLPNRSTKPNGRRYVRRWLTEEVKAWMAALPRCAETEPERRAS